MMCEKGAYGSLINLRVLSCEVLRGKAATVEMAGASSAPAATQPRSARGERPSPQGNACSQIDYLPSEMPPENLCLMKMMLIWQMSSCSSPWRSSLRGSFFFTLILLGLCSLPFAFGCSLHPAGLTHDSSRVTLALWCL